MLPAGTQTVYVFSDDPTLAGTFKTRYAIAADPAELSAPSVGALSPIQIDALDLLAMSMCGQIVAPQLSSFSATAALIGGVDAQRIGELIDKDTQISILENSKSSTYPVIRGMYEEFSDLLHMARLYDDTGLLQKADREFSDLHHRFPDNPNGVSAYLQFKNKQRDFAAALKAGRTAIGADITNHIIYRQTGLAALEMEEGEFALECAEKALKLQPANAIYHMAAGEAAVACKRYDQAIRAFSHPSVRHLRHAGLYKSMFQAHYQNGAHDIAAAVACDAVTDLSASRTQDNFIAGIIDNILPTEALVAALDLVDAKGAQPISAARAAALAYIRGAIALQLGQLDRSLAEFQTAVELAPLNKAYLQRVAELYLRSGRLQEAESAYQVMLDTDTPSLAAFGGMVSTLQQLGRPEDAFDTVDRASTLFSSNAPALCQIANWMMQLAQHSEAEAMFRAAIEVNSNYSHAYNGLSYALHRQARRAEALDAVCQAIGIDPNIAAFHAQHGLLLAQSEQHLEAAEAYEKAVDLNPGLAPAHQGLGRALHQVGRLDEAIASMCRAVELKPHNAQFRAELDALSGTKDG
jgi:tetratricopeptide (TPR) repeat protein